MAKISPMMQQYLDIKEKHKDHVLFFRLGDFYEMFFDDAMNISRVLGLTLTARDCGLAEKAPMCGIPYHSSNTYIKKLLDNGYKVAVCEQLESPSEAKGIVQRDVVRIITPGTLIEDDFLNEANNNYIAMIYVKSKEFCICFSDISTGELAVIHKKSKNLGHEIVTELSKFMPTEVLINSEILACVGVTDFLKHKLKCVCELLDDVSISTAEEILTKQFTENELENSQVLKKPIMCIAIASLLEYVKNVQRDAINNINSINVYSEEQFMGIDYTAKRNLELTQTMLTLDKKGSLLWVLDKTKTSMGKRYLKQQIERPLVDPIKIVNRQQAIYELLADPILLEDLREMLDSVYDLQRLLTRLIYGAINPRELLTIAKTMEVVPQIKKLLNGRNSKYLVSIYENIYDIPDVFEMIKDALCDPAPVTVKDGEIIREGFNSILDEHNGYRKNSKEILANIVARERDATGIKNLKTGFNKVYGYYLEVTNSYKDLVPQSYIRRQTLTGAERYITEELKTLEEKILSSNERILLLEQQIYNELKAKVLNYQDELQSIANCIIKLDFITSLAYVAQQNNYCCPVISLKGDINIKEGRHPVVEQLLDSGKFVPNDTLLDMKSNKMSIITGPNMAGKSTYMRQVAIITIMAQIGSYVPATAASISICDKVFTRVGASDDLSTGQSTFMVEMSEVANILTNATNNSLVILDEIGRGTSTYDGMSIAKAVVHNIVTDKKLSCKCMFATHYHELTELENELDGVINYNIAVRKNGDDIQFLRKIIRGGADESYGIEVSKLAGVPNKVVEKAKEFLQQLESNQRVYTPKEVDKQITLEQQNHKEITKLLQITDVDNITAREALDLLYKLKKLL